MWELVLTLSNVGPRYWVQIIGIGNKCLPSLLVGLMWTLNKCQGIFKIEGYHKQSSEVRNRIHARLQFKITERNWAWWNMPVITAFGRLRHEDCWEFRTSLGYIVKLQNSGPACATYQANQNWSRKTLSKSKNIKQNKQVKDKMDTFWPNVDLGWVSLVSSLAPEPLLSLPSFRSLMAILVWMLMTMAMMKVPQTLLLVSLYSL